MQLQRLSTKVLGRQQACRLSSTSTSTTTTSSNQHILAATQKWFETIVVDEKLCPFAPPFVQNPHRLRIVTSNASNTKEAIRDVAAEVQLLLLGSNNDGSNNSVAPAHETTLVVLENDKTADAPSFINEFRDFVRLSWELQEEAVGDEFVSDVQLVLFHPQATHQTYGADTDDSPSDYTIRSPYPTIHLLREVDVLRAVKGSYPNLETLPTRNKEKMVQQGLDMCQRRLEACYSTKQ